MIPVAYSKTYSLACEYHQPMLEVDLRLPALAQQLDEVLEILNEFEEQHVVDLVPHQHYLNPSSRVELDAAFHKFRRREIGRMGAYIVYLVTLEQLVKKDFLYTAMWIERFVPGTRNSFQREIESRDAELEKYRTYRHKVFAHTSYAWPKGDHLSVQLTSLKFLTGNPTSFDQDGIQLGGFSVGETPPGGMPFEWTNFAQIASDAANHHTQWQAMFSRLMDRARAIPDAQILKAYPDLKDVRRMEPS